MVFGIFKKKKGGARPIDPTDGARKIINLQIELAKKHCPDQWMQRLERPYSRGYIVGVCNALHQTVDSHDPATILGSITVIHLELFGPELGQTLVHRTYLACNEEGEGVDEFLKGQMWGGQEVLDAIPDKTTPMGLAVYLVKEVTPYDDFSS